MPPDPSSEATLVRACIIAVTGGIGSGKSTVADRFVALGAGLVDTDLIAHELTAPGGAAIDAIRTRFGDDAIAADGRMDRARMRARVFADPSLRHALEAILHPLIRAAADRQTADLAARHPYVLVAVPLLVESGAHWRERCDRVLVVDCPVDVQLQRLRQRPGLDPTQAQAIVNSQASREQRLAIADDVVDNSGDIAALDAQVRALDANYRHCAAPRQRRPSNP